MARRLARGGHEVVAFNRSSERAVALAREEKGITAVPSLAELADKLSPPRTVWMMLTEGNPTEEALQSLFSVLSKGDTVIDGGNSNFQDTLRRACACTEKGIHLVDVGTSGGIWGL
ncbi:MAG: NAD(P)-binding domain-containing protein, partial [Syntrophales bacterium]|nr:NAD(P)-binding domain-containing protein [Syntrophales bacterium]